MTAKVFHAELWGKRQAKYDALNAADIEDTTWDQIAPQNPFYLFKPQNIEMLDEYQKGWKITEVVPINSIGVVTGQDAETIAFSSESASHLAKRHGLDSKVIRPLLYRPFDRRFIVYDGSVVTRTRTKIMRHMLAGENLGLLTSRQVPNDFRHVFASRLICSFNAISTAGRFGSGPFFPLYLYPDPSHPAGRTDEYWSAGKDGRRPNLNPEFVKEIEGKLGLTFVSDGCGDLKRTFGPEDVFHYMYAVFHSPTYRSRYAEFLKIDFPRLSLTCDVKLFVKLSGLGSELVGLHLLESPDLDNPPVRYPIKDDDTVAKGYPKYVPGGSTGVSPVKKEKKDMGETPMPHIVSKDGGRVHINAKQYFEPVAEEVWEFHVGGYQVCQKWLKDRRGRKLSYDDITHYSKVVVALGETIRLMGEIDAAIPAWPIK